MAKAAAAEERAKVAQLEVEVRLAYEREAEAVEGLLVLGEEQSKVRRRLAAHGLWKGDHRGAGVFDRLQLRGAEHVAGQSAVAAPGQPPARRRAVA